MTDRRSSRRTFYLNERHELSPVEQRGGGGAIKLAPVDWAAKGERIYRSLSRARKKLDSSKDPLATKRYFLLAQPEDAIRKISESKNRPGEYEEGVAWAGKDSFVFQRLGIDLVDVTAGGDAIVHLEPETLERMSSIASRLEKVGNREQARFVSIMQFGEVPPQLRYDPEWSEQLPTKKSTDVVIELQPMLRPAEADQVIQALRPLLRQDREEGIRATGTDFSGRMWLRSMLRKATIVEIARSFFSIQSIHSPLVTLFAASRSRRKGSRPSYEVTTTRGSARLPAVGVVDCGIPADHSILGPFRRATFAHPEALPEYIGDHGSSVASRVVFGDLDLQNDLDPAPVGECEFVDIRVAVERNKTEDKMLVPVLETSIIAAPDVRVFNFSFSDHVPLDNHRPTMRAEKLRAIQDLDNLIAARDVLVCVAAGNSETGQIPAHAYPEHHKDPDWQLGHWARAVNALTCGSFVRWPTPNGMASHEYAPSPFCKSGPGIGGSLKPDLSANGGDWAAGYVFRPGTGVAHLTADGVWEDHSGTSLSTPIVAREAAKCLAELQHYCDPGTRPFAVTAKAHLALNAARGSLPPRYEELAKHTLGHGEPSARWLSRPPAEIASFVWQGILSSSKEFAYLQIPIPLDWINEAELPWLTICFAWDTPVNAAIPEIYGCRQVGVRLRPNPDQDAVRARVRRPAPPKTYPLVLREFDLARGLELFKKKGVEVDGDVWVLELSYTELASYPASLIVSPEQRVGLAIRLEDKGDEPISPHDPVASHPMASTMTRLSKLRLRPEVPVRLKVKS
jgi:hypothetical protein